MRCNVQISIVSKHKDDTFQPATSGNLKVLSNSRISLLGEHTWILNPRVPPRTHIPYYRLRVRVGAAIRLWLTIGIRLAIGVIALVVALVIVVVL